MEEDNCFYEQNARALLIIQRPISGLIRAPPILDWVRILITLPGTGRVPQRLWAYAVYWMIPWGLGLMLDQIEFYLLQVPKCDWM